MDAEAETTPEPESPFGSANASFGFQKTYNADNDGLKADLKYIPGLSEDLARLICASKSLIHGCLR